MHLIADKQESGEEFAVITVIASNLRQACRPGTMMVVDQYGQLAGGGLEDSLLQEKARQEAEKSLSRGISRKIILNSEEGSVEIFINVFCRKDRLIIVGSGSLVQDIYQIAVILGYYISIIDNRSETLIRDRFPLAHELLLGDIVELLNSCEITEDTSIVIASHHHEFDEAALQAVIKSPARYIGVLGNKRKVTAYFGRLNEMEIPDELINRVYIPIGLDLGGQKTSEIALAVMAEIQAIKYGRPGGFLSMKHVKKGIERREELF